MDVGCDGIQDIYGERVEEIKSLQLDFIIGVIE